MGARSYARRMAHLTPEELRLMQAQPHLASEQMVGHMMTTRVGLPDALKSGMESLSGMSMDEVRVHYNSAGPSTLSAHAFAQGHDIHAAPGEERHLPHEAWHVVQQGGFGRPR